MAVRLEVTLFWYRPHCFCCANKLGLMLTSWHLHEKSRGVCINESKVTSSLACIHGQVTKHTTVKWPIHRPRGNTSYGLYKYVWPQRVWFFKLFVINKLSILANSRLQGWYYVKDVSRHQQSRIATMNNCFVLLGTHQHCDSEAM